MRALEVTSRFSHARYLHPTQPLYRGDARREQVGGAPISDFETLTLGGGDRAAPPVLTMEGVATYQIPLTIGREPSALKKERSHPPPLPPRRDYEGSPTAAAGDVDAMAYDTDAAVDWNDSAGAGAGTAPPLPPRGGPSTVEPLTVGGGSGAVRRKEAYPGASPSRRRGSGALQLQQQKQKPEGGGPPPPLPSPRLIKGGFGPPNAGPLSWTDAKTGGDRRRGAASAAATSNARVAGNSNYSQQQQQQQQRNQRHSSRHNRTASDASSSVAASARVATSASPSKPRRARATSGNVGLGGAGRVAAAGPLAVGAEQQQPAAAGGGVAVAAGGGVGDAGVAGGGGAGGGGAGVAGTGRVAVAKYEYTAQGPEQLSFRVGDTVHLHTDKVRAART